MTLICILKYSWDKARKTDTSTIKAQVNVDALRVGRVLCHCFHFTTKRNRHGDFRWQRNHPRPMLSADWYSLQEVPQSKIVNWVDSRNVEATAEIYPIYWLRNEINQQSFHDTDNRLGSLD